jgi:hypothetical protein
MRAVSPFVATFRLVAYAACAIPVLAGCQDSYASNAERDTHMGEVQAAVASSAPQSAFGALPPPTPGAATEVGAVLAVPPPADGGASKDAGAAKDAAPAHGPAHHAK